MNLEEIPFKIGMEYENWEFDLDITKDRIIGCDSYLYNKPVYINDVQVKSVELIFCTDILIAILINSSQLTINSLYILDSLGFYCYGKYFFQSTKELKSLIFESLTFEDIC